MSIDLDALKWIHVELSASYVTKSEFEDDRILIESDTISMDIAIKVFCSHKMHFTDVNRRGEFIGTYSITENLM